MFNLRKTPATSATMLAAAGLHGMMLASPALAAPEHNCAAYATKAVEQQKQNQQLGCGFTVGGWSLDYNAHLLWCQRPDVDITMISQGDAIREQAIADCYATKQASEKKDAMRDAAKAMQEQAAKEKDVACGQYAIDARDQNQQNISLNCGFTGGVWSDDVNGHRNWCMRDGVDAANAEDKKRQAMLAECKTTRRFVEPKQWVRFSDGSLHLPVDLCSAPDRAQAAFCDGGVADSFCKRNGFARHSKFTVGSKSGKGHHTAILGTNQTCMNKTCNYFASITCVR